MADAELSLPLPILVISDYVCPWCYVGMGEVERLREEYDIAITWLPFELHPGGPPEGRQRPAHDDDGRNETRSYLKQRAEALGLPFERTEVTPTSRKALEATEFAREAGEVEFERFHHRVFGAYFGEGRNIGLPDVLCELAVECGLDAEALRAALDAGTYGERVEGATRWAKEAGIHTTPTFLIGEEYALEGAQEQQVFRQAMEQIGAPTFPGNRQGHQPAG